MGEESLESKFASIKPRVEFVDVQDQYASNSDLIIQLNLVDYDVEEGDRVAIFKLGWQQIKEYVVFEWVPKLDGNNVAITFNKYCLPRSTIEIYQFCYITGNNVVHGASEPFQFCENPTKMYQSHTTMTKCENATVNVLPPPLTVTSSTLDESEILRLKDENKFLRDALKVIIAQNNGKAHAKDIEELKHITSNLQETLNLQQGEIKTLKSKIKESGEEYKKLYIEKVKVEKKYEKLKNRQFVKTLDNFEIGELESIPPFPFAK